VTSADIEDAHEEVESSSHTDSESEASSSVSCPNTPKAREPKKRSPIWQYFLCEGSEKAIQTFFLVKIEEKDKEDKYCKNDVNQGRKTTNMRLLLENHHIEELKTARL
jgi:hypothetical protein